MRQIYKININGNCCISEDKRDVIETLEIFLDCPSLKDKICILVDEMSEEDLNKLNDFEGF